MPDEIENIAPPLYAAIVVNVDAPGLRQPFTYSIPQPLSGQIKDGDSVVVPFGKQTAIGYIIGFSDRIPDYLAPESIKDITARIEGGGASLPKSVLQTARWMARTYLADLAQCIRGVIPDTQTSHAIRKIQLSADWEAALAAIATQSHRELLLALSEFPNNEATPSELQKVLGSGKIASPIQLLRKRGVLIDRWTIEPPKISAREVRTRRLLVDWDKAEEEALHRETKKPGQARLLRTLAAAGGSRVVASLAFRDSKATTAALNPLIVEGLVLAEVVEIHRRPGSNARGNVAPPLLTSEQSAVLEDLKIRLASREKNTALLYGVTASGKTEVYLRAIAETRRLGRTALVLVPEIALTAQVVDTFRSRIGDRVAVMHSGLSDGERRDEWQRIWRGQADVVVGARSAVFAPLENIGLIVVDEEHEGSYKQDNPSPRYHARDVAIARARATGATVLLGSATPSIESFFRAESGEWGLLPLRQRVLSRPLPSVEIVDLREGYKKGAPPAGVFSPSLLDAIEDRLSKREQVILFLNRRGFAAFLLCRDCGYATRCPHCDVSLTYHAHIRRLTCHHCGYERQAPTICPSCNSERIRPFGIGTEKVEEEVTNLFPNARVLRLDRDTTAKKGSSQNILNTFRNGDADILIGTQMVAKGLDFAGVTLVGVVSADTALNMPDFRASERAFQLLTQVSGRAGRGRKEGHVIVQTFNPEHESVVAAAEHDYDLFYRREITYRRELWYPPFTRLANIIAQDDSSEVAEQKLRLLSSRLGGRTANILDGPHVSGDRELILLGPAPCPLSRLREKYRWHLLIKCEDDEVLRSRVKAAMRTLSSAEKMGISIDIDPISLL